MISLLENRNFVSIVVAAAGWVCGRFYAPFPEQNLFFQLILVHKPHIFHSVKWTYDILWFATPYIAASMLLSLGYVFLRRSPGKLRIRLPRYPPPAERKQLQLVLGEIHHPKKPIGCPDPQWLTVPTRGLSTGIAIFGAVGSGKTTCCMYPFAEQILGYQAADRQRRVSGLVLEVKGDFCSRVQEILNRYGRDQDFIEITIDGGYRYNPLHNDLDPYAQAYAIASLVTNLFGRGKEPFWQQAYTNLLKFILSLHKTLYDYVTLFDLYESVISPDVLARKIEEGRQRFLPARYLLVELEEYSKNENIAGDLFEKDEALSRMKAEWTPELEQLLKANRVDYEIQIEEGTGNNTSHEDPDKAERFAAVNRWYHGDWMRLEPKLRTSIMEGISVFLSLFDDNPAVKRTFCPTKECYDEANSAKPVDGAKPTKGTPLPPFSDLIESGKVVALNFPVSTNPGLAKAIGTFLKQDFQRAMLNRIPRMEGDRDRHWRDVLFLCDEYHAFATVGESDPSGDEKFFSLSRQAKCIPIVATQSISSLRSTLPGESWRTLLQTFRTKIFLSLSDDFSTRVASDLCGREEQLKEHYSISENSHDARVSLFSGRTTAHKATVSTSKSYNILRDAVFEPKIFAELKNAQSIVLAYDGLNPLPPSYCYLKPYYLDPNRSYFEQLERGEI